MHTVSVYERIPNFQKSLDAPSAGQYFQLVTQLVNDGVEWVDDVIENPDINRELKEDLERIVELRNRYQRSQ